MISKSAPTINHNQPPNIFLIVLGTFSLNLFHWNYVVIFSLSSLQKCSKLAPKFRLPPGPEATEGLITSLVTPEDGLNILCVI